MIRFLNSPLTLGNTTLSNRLIQGPLAGYSCASFRRLFSYYREPAYCVSEMLSAQDVITKHTINNRYLYRAVEEKRLAYQISGNDPEIMARAAVTLEQLGADLIDINCGCPKTKIRKKGAGSALLEAPEHLLKIVKTVRKAISCPLTVKIRLLSAEQDIDLAVGIENAGADALIIHPRRAIDDYSTPIDISRVALIKQHLTIPLILNGDITSIKSLNELYKLQIADAFMISRAGTGNPWLYKELLTGVPQQVPLKEQRDLFLQHLQHLASLENEYLAVLQSKSLVRYYFRLLCNPEWLKKFYSLSSLSQIESFMQQSFSNEDTYKRSGNL